MADLNEFVADPRQRHRYVSIGAPRVSRWQGILPRYSVDWIESITGLSGWGYSRTVWFQRRAYDFAGRFVVVHRPPEASRDWHAALCERVASG